MKINKLETTRKILEKGVRLKCTKLEMQNIVFPRWEELGLIGNMFRQCIRTKEQPQGHIYDEEEYQVVLRIIGGKVLFEGKPDCYCWKHSKVESAKKVEVIGNNSFEGLMNILKVLSAINDEKERCLVSDMFAMLKKDFLIVTTPAEERTCIQVTSDFFTAGITQCVDEWMETDENGNAEGTVICLGDYLVVTDNGVYRIGREEFEKTHVINLNQKEQML